MKPPRCQPQHPVNWSPAVVKILADARTIAQDRSAECLSLSDVVISVLGHSAENSVKASAGVEQARASMLSALRAADQKHDSKDVRPTIHSDLHPSPELRKVLEVAMRLAWTQRAGDVRVAHVVQGIREAGQGEVATLLIRFPLALDEREVGWG